MSKEVKPPRRLRIRPHCYIDGVRIDEKGQQRRLKPGLYVLGKNLSEAEAARLASPAFSHCVEILADRPPEEVLAEDVEAPTPDPAFDYIEKKREQAEAERAQRYTLRKLPK